MTLSLKFSALFFMAVFSSALIAPINATAATAQKKSDKQDKEVLNEVTWELYSSDSAIYTVRFPEEYKYRLYPIMLTDSSAIYSEEVVATVTSPIDPTDVKDYLVRLDQSFGAPINSTVAKELLAEEEKKYISFARQNNGSLVTNENIEINGFLGKDFYITYTETKMDETNKRALRIRVMLTDTAKVQMVLSGGSTGMYSYQSDNFFSSLRLTDGYGKASKKQKKDWKSFAAPNNLFTMVIPPKNLDYRPQSPKYKLSKRVSSAHVTFTDPVVGKKTFYNVYAYKIGTPVNEKLVKKILFGQHLAKFVQGAMEDSLNLNIADKDGYKVASTQIIIEPKEDIPYVDAIMLRAYFKGDVVVVQEMAGTQGHALGDFSKSIMDSLLFHPEKFKQVTAEEILKNNQAYLKSKEGDAAPVQPAATDATTTPPPAAAPKKQAEPKPEPAKTPAAQ